MGKTPSKDLLNNAIRQEQEDEIRKILRQDPKLINDYINNNNDQTSLCLAVYYGSLKSIKILIEEFNHEINKPDAIDNYTPLIISCKRKETNIAIYLIENGADLTYVDKLNLNCLDYALIHAAYDICFYFMKNHQDKLKLKPLDDYINLHRDLNLPIFNIISFYQCLNDFVEPNATPSFRVTFNPNNSIEGKVPDPNETWHQFMKRILQFKLYKPPMIEKEKVPAEQRRSLWMKVQSKLLEIEYDKKISLDDESEEPKEKQVDIENHINVELKENTIQSVGESRRNLANNQFTKTNSDFKINQENYPIYNITKLPMKDEIPNN